SRWLAAPLFSAGAVKHADCAGGRRLDLWGQRTRVRPAETENLSPVSTTSSPGGNTTVALAELQEGQEGQQQERGKRDQRRIKELCKEVWHLDAALLGDGIHRQIWRSADVRTCAHVNGSSRSPRVSPRAVPSARTHGLQPARRIPSTLARCPRKLTDF